MKKWKIAHLTSAHLPFDTRIFYKECQTLAKAGFEVVLIVPHDRNLEIDGVKIRAVPRPKSRRARMTGTIWQILRSALKEKAEIYHFHDPELIPVGIFLKLCGKKVIYDVHEDLPRQIMSKYWIPKNLRGFVARVAETAENIGVRLFDGTAVANPVVAKRFLSKKMIIVRNFPLLDEFASCNQMPYNLRPPAITYIGGISNQRGVYEMVNAMAMLPKNKKYILHLAGAFIPDNIAKEVSLLPGWPLVKYEGYLARTGVAELIGRVRVGLIPLYPIPNYLSNYPVKLFEYMAGGLPVIASDLPLCREVIDGTRCGLIVEPQNPEALAEAIQWLLSHSEEAEAMGRRGRDAVQNCFNWQREGEELVALYYRILAIKKGVESSTP